RAGLQRPAQDRRVHSGGRDARALQRRLGGDLAQLGGRQGRQGAEEGADRRAGGGDDDDVGHFYSLPGEILPGLCRIRPRPSPVAMQQSAKRHRRVAARAGNDGRRRALKQGRRRRPVESSSMLKHLARRICTPDELDMIEHYQTRAERMADLWVHLIGLALAVAGGVVLAVLASVYAGVGAAVSTAIYALCLVAMLTASTVYNLTHPC